jgi:hypothetical protein
LPVGLERLLSLKTIDWYESMKYGIFLQDISAVPKGSKEYLTIMTYIRQIEIALKPAKPRKILSALARLRLHYATSHMSEQELALMLEDYINDLAEYPKDILENACIEYRKDGRNLFFPKVGQLIALVKQPWQLRKEKLHKLKKLVEASK